MLLFGIGTPQAVTAGLVVPARPRLLQGRPLPRRRCGRARDGHAGRGRAGGPAPGDAADGVSPRRSPPHRWRACRCSVASSPRSSSTTASAWRRCPGLGAVMLVSLVVAASMCLGAAGLIAGIAPFRGDAAPTPAAHDAPPALWLGPLVLGAMGVMLGLLPAWVPARSPSAARPSRATDRPPSPRPLARLHPDAGAQRGDPGRVGRPLRLACPSVAAAVAARRCGPSSLYTFTLTGLDAAQPPHRPGAAERARCVVRPHGHRHGDRAGRLRAGDRARLADATPLDVDSVPRRRAGGADRRRRAVGRVRPLEHGRRLVARLWSVTASP